MGGGSQPCRRAHPACPLRSPRPPLSAHGSLDRHQSWPSVPKPPTVRERSRAASASVSATAAQLHLLRHAAQAQHGLAPGGNATIKRCYRAAQYRLLPLVEYCRLNETWVPRRLQPCGKSSSFDQSLRRSGMDLRSVEVVRTEDGPLIEVLHRRRAWHGDGRDAGLDTAYARFAQPAGPQVGVSPPTRKGCGPGIQAWPTAIVAGASCSRHLALRRRYA